MNFFVDALAGVRERIGAAVSSSNATTARLQAIGIKVLDLNDVDHLNFYVDGADEATRARHLIKGGGAALTREKIVTAAASRFVCIVDDGKVVTRLGKFPLPIEVIPMATLTRRARARRLRWSSRYGARDVSRTTAITSSTYTTSPSSTHPALEQQLNQLAGVVTVGLFANRPADVLLIATAHDVEVA